MFVVEEQVFLNGRRSCRCRLRQLTAEQRRHGQERLAGLDGHVRRPRRGGFAGRRTESVGPPVGPGLPVHGQFTRMVLPDHVEEFTGHGASQLRPGVSLVPSADHVAWFHRGGRIVGAVAAVLNRDRVERIVPIFERMEVAEQALLKRGQIAFVDLPVVPRVVMFRPQRHDPFSGRRFPPKWHRQIERQQRPGLVAAHYEILQADAVEEFWQAPGGTVDVVLHGGANVRTERLFDLANRLQGCGHVTIRWRSRPCSRTCR